jgi:DNA-directed RNA polymerase subunit N (RpoN/RPB10)
MLYPVCPTCRMLLADKQLPYEKMINELDSKDYSHEKYMKEKTKILDKLGLTRYCCRMRIISYVDHVKIVV